MKNVNYSEKITSQGKEIFLNFEAVMPLSVSTLFPEGKLKDLLLDLETTLSIKCNVLIIQNDEFILHNVVTFKSEAISGIRFGISCPILKNDGIENVNTLFDESLGLIYDYEDYCILDLDNYSKENLIELLEQKGELLIEEYEKLDERSIGRMFGILENADQLVQEIIRYALTD